MGVTFLVGVLLLSMIPRCNSEGTVPTEVRTFQQHIQTNRVKVGNLTIEIRPFDGSISKEYSSEDDRVIVVAGATRVSINDYQLSVNDEFFGTIHDQAFILVDDGDVYVDNIPRSPIDFVP